MLAINEETGTTLLCTLHQGSFGPLVHESRTCLCICLVRNGCSQRLQPRLSSLNGVGPETKRKASPAISRGILSSVLAKRARWKCTCESTSSHLLQQTTKQARNQGDIQRRACLKRVVAMCMRILTYPSTRRIENPCPSRPAAVTCLRWTAPREFSTACHSGHRGPGPESRTLPLPPLCRWPVNARRSALVDKSSEDRWRFRWCRERTFRHTLQVQILN